MDTKQQLDEIQKAIDAIRENLGLNRSEKPNSCEPIEPDYTHLLPEGYEFCAEQDAENWVKVQLNLDVPESEQSYIGYVWHTPFNPSSKHYRPIRKIQYRIAVHESVTAEHDPYQVDWEKAPEKADSHCFDENGKGWFYGTNINDNYWYADNCGWSGFTLPTGLDWKLSKTIRPKTI
jgi:hypothetical protein